mmetsp:Transcript_129232/g.223812  ORF Transcript_129232/g.223812 Transcript_129232/m.223812 type:complete len:101 (-) Transcript_129232:14-316(-)
MRESCCHSAAEIQASQTRPGQARLSVKRAKTCVHGRMQQIYMHAGRLTLKRFQEGIKYLQVLNARFFSSVPKTTKKVSFGGNEICLIPAVRPLQSHADGL